MKKTTSLISTALFVLAVAGTAAAQQKIVVCGTGDSQELLRTLASAFEKANPGTAVEVPDSIGSGGGVKATAAGECDLGRLARPIKEKEKVHNLNYGAFAYSPVVFVTDPDVKVSAVTSGQIVDIFSGKTTRWSDLGGADAAIAVVNREAKDSSRGVIGKHIKEFKAIEKPAGMTAHTTPEAVEAIVTTENVIGYLPMAMAKGKNLTVLKVDEVLPTAINVHQGKYKMVSPFGIVWKGELSGLADSFYKFIKGKEGQAIVIDFGVIPSELL